MVFQVPQFIDTEDRIIGPLTLRQAGYVGIAGAVAFILYFILPIGAWVMSTIFFLAVAAAFAFIKINGRSFSSFIAAFMGYYWKSQRYVWQPEHPAMPKSAASAPAAGHLSIEKIVSGLALKNAWKTMQTGSTFKEEPVRPTIRGTERYQIFQAATGENRAAKRIDYR